MSTPNRDQESNDTYRVICYEVACGFQSTHEHATDARTAAVEHSQSASRIHGGHVVHVEPIGNQDEHPVVGTYMDGEQRQRSRGARKVIHGPGGGETQVADDQHRLADVDSIVVDPDMILRVLRDRHPGEKEHAIRIDPPFTGTVKGKVELIDPRYEHLSYRETDVPAPAYLPPQVFLQGSDNGWKVADEWAFPHRRIERVKFDISQGIPAGTVLTDEQEDEWEEIWRDRVRRWERAVLEGLQDEIEVVGAANTDDYTSISVEYDVEPGRIRSE